MIFPALFASGMALVEALNDNLGNAGFIVIGLFIACWIISLAVYRWRGYDAISV